MAESSPLPEQSTADQILEQQNRVKLATELGMPQLVADSDQLLQDAFAIPKQANEARYTDLDGTNHKWEQGEADHRGELTPDVLVRAHAENSEMGFAIAQAKAGRIDEARRSLDDAHVRGEEAVKKHAEGSAKLKAEVGPKLREVKELLGGGENGTVELSRQDSPLHEKEMDDEVKALIGASAEPVDVIKYKDMASGREYTTLVYNATASNKLAYMVRYTNDGQVVSRQLLVTTEQAFKKGSLQRRLHLGEAVEDAANEPTSAEDLPEPLDFSALKSQVRHERSAAIKGHLASSGAPENTLDFDTTLSTYSPVTHSMEALGYDDATIAAVTRQKRGKSVKRRRGFLSGLLGS